MFHQLLEPDNSEIGTTHRYQQSEIFLERALKSIPLGSQTFSKSKTQFPYGVSPYFIQKGLGSKVFDIDGNAYIDFINGLLSITLGYADPEINAAVSAQLQEGVIFSLPHPLEMQVAEKIIEMVPCAEKVRFGKNGSDATSGAIRLARAFTGRDHVAVCGYHGWQDWYIGSTARYKGVPKSVRDLTHTFQYNNIESLHQVFKEYPDQIAAVILEPMNTHLPENQFLETVKELTHQHNALLIFDETITGFRFSRGGAQEYFGVTPDLSTFGKGLANGFPLSAVAGLDRYMHLMEEIFFSFTFGGETLSLAASLAVLNKLQKEPVLETISNRGQQLKTGVQQLIRTHQLEETLDITGHPSWTFLHIKDTLNYSSWELKTLFLQEVLKRGFLTFGTHNMSYTHSEEDVKQLLEAYNEIFRLMKSVIQDNSLSAYLKAKPLEPLFKVR